jgi:hypothetical protein
MVQMPGSSAPPGIDTFVAIGDSFTEGLNDPAPGGGFRGSADLVAGALAARPPAARPGRSPWLAARRQDARWIREYAGPWLRRRVGGTSSGDGVLPKRPDLLPL